MKISRLISQLFEIENQDSLIIVKWNTENAEDEEYDESFDILYVWNAKDWTTELYFTVIPENTDPVGSKLDWEYIDFDTITVKELIQKLIANQNMEMSLVWNPVNPTDVQYDKHFYDVEIWEDGDSTITMFLNGVI